MLRSPAEYMLKYIISLDPVADISDLVHVCQLYRLHYISSQHLEVLRKEMSPIPMREKLENPSLKELEWMRDHGIASIWTDEDVRHDVNFILEHRRVRETVESMFLAGYKSEDIANFLDAVSADGVAAYRHYVFNLDLLSTDEVTAFLSQQSRIYKSLWENRGSDAKEFVLHHLGIAPRQATVESAGRRLVQMINNRLFMLSDGMPGVDDSNQIKNYAKALKAAADIVGTGDDAVVEFKKLLDSLNFTTDNDNILTFEELRHATGHNSESRGGTPKDSAGSQ